MYLWGCLRLATECANTESGFAGRGLRPVARFTDAEPCALPCADCVRQQRTPGGSSV